MQEMEQQRLQQKERIPHLRFWRVEKKAVLSNQDLINKMDAEKMEIEDKDEIDDVVTVVHQPL